MNWRTVILPGSKNEKAWQDVIDILDAGIDVITAVNIQHIERINEDVATDHRGRSKGKGAR